MEQTEMPLESIVSNGYVRCLEDVAVDAQRVVDEYEMDCDSTEFLRAYSSLLNGLKLLRQYYLGGK